MEYANDRISSVEADVGRIKDDISEVKSQRRALKNELESFYEDDTKVQKRKGDD